MAVVVTGTRGLSSYLGPGTRYGYCMPTVCLGLVMDIERDDTIEKRNITPR